MKYETRVILDRKISTPIFLTKFKEAAQEMGGRVLRKDYDIKEETVLVFGSVREEHRREASVDLHVSFPYSNYRTRWFKSSEVDLQIRSKENFWDAGAGVVGGLRDLKTGEVIDEIIVQTLVMGKLPRQAKILLACIPIVGWVVLARSFLHGESDSPEFLPHREQEQVNTLAMDFIGRLSNHLKPVS